MKTSKNISTTSSPNTSYSKRSHRSACFSTFLKNHLNEFKLIGNMLSRAFRELLKYLIGLVLAVVFIFLYPSRLISFLKQIFRTALLALFFMLTMAMCVLHVLYFLRDLILIIPFIVLLLLQIFLLIRNILFWAFWAGLKSYNKIEDKIKYQVSNSKSQNTRGLRGKAWNSVLSFFMLQSRKERLNNHNPHTAMLDKERRFCFVIHSLFVRERFKLRREVKENQDPNLKFQIQRGLRGKTWNLVLTFLKRLYSGIIRFPGNLAYDLRLSYRFSCSQTKIVAKSIKKAVKDLSSKLMTEDCGLKTFFLCIVVFMLRMFLDFIQLIIILPWFVFPIIAVQLASEEVMLTLTYWDVELGSICEDFGNKVIGKKVIGIRKVEVGSQWSIVIGQKTMENRQWTIVIGQKSIVNGHWSVVIGQKSLVISKKERDCTNIFRISIGKKNDARIELTLHNATTAKTEVILKTNNSNKNNEFILQYIYRRRNRPPYMIRVCGGRHRRFFLKLYCQTKVQLQWMDSTSRSTLDYPTTTNV